MLERRNRLNIYFCLQDYQQFDCMKQLSLKFERTLERTEQQLDMALSKLCLDYNEEVQFNLIRQTDTG